MGTETQNSHLSHLSDTRGRHHRSVPAVLPAIIEVGFLILSTPHLPDSHYPTHGKGSRGKTDCGLSTQCRGCRKEVQPGTVTDKPEVQWLGWPETSVLWDIVPQENQNEVSANPWELKDTGRLYLFIVICLLFLF